VVVAIGTHAEEYPEELGIDISSDGSSWSEIRRGRTAASAFRAAIEDPRETRLVFDVGGRAGRFVRLRQAGRSPRFGWSIAEIRVHAP
jgi:hypothetical protein